MPAPSLLEVKKLRKIGTGGLEKIEHFYLSKPITLHPQNSIFFYLRIYPEWPIPMSGNIHLFLSLSLSAD